MEKLGPCRSAYIYEPASRQAARSKEDDLLFGGSGSCFGVGGRRHDPAGAARRWPRERVAGADRQRVRLVRLHHCWAAAGAHVGGRAARWRRRRRVLLGRGRCRAEAVGAEPLVATASCADAATRADAVLARLGLTQLHRQHLLHAVSRLPREGRVARRGAAASTQFC